MSGERAVLALADGTIFQGEAFGAEGVAVGEVVFTTGLTGYQEVLTDPSYCGQIVTMTAPHIGNTGVVSEDHESGAGRPHIAGLLVRDVSEVASNYRADETLDAYLRRHGVCALTGVDTRRLTRHLRDKGSQNGAFGRGSADEMVRRAREAPAMAGLDLVPRVSCAEPYEARAGRGAWATSPAREARFHVVAFDFGLKQNILRCLVDAGCRVTVVPAQTTADEALALAPDGVFLSNGPGDPAAVTYGVEAARGLLGKVPLFGICLGHQLLAHALGASTYKLKFGHRGLNQPVLDVTTGRVAITSQNHGFVVDPQSLAGRADTTHVHLNDRTSEGLSVPSLRAFSVQFHPEAAAGPHDALGLFDRFYALMERAASLRAARGPEPEGNRLAMPSRRTVHLVSLGCPKNRVDSEVLLGVAEQEGLKHVADPAEADVIVVNTCGFIGNAKKESLETIFELASYKEGRCDTLVVAGCLSQRHPRELADQMPEVDHFLGSSDMLRLADVLRGGAPRMLVGNPAEWLVKASDPRRVSTGSASAYVKIAEGCNRTCSFCVIPQLRGAQRSRPADDVVREVEALAARGVFEINLVSQDTVSYGRDLPKEGRDSLSALVARVAEVPGVRWVRLHYLYPESLTAELLELLSGHPRVLPYVDMPLQHAADAMLRRMRRGHGGERLRRVVATLRERVPGLVFRTAFIVGHPGETEAEFDELLAFVAWAQFDHVGVFRYSDEESSRSFALEGKVPARTSAARHRRLMALQRRVAHAKNRALVGRTLEVLVEGASDEHEYVMMGRHAGQAPGVDGQVYLSGEPAKAGELRRVEITQASDYDLVGEVLDEAPLVAAPRAAKSGGRRLPMAPSTVS